ncbi:MAG: hypothetical protein INH12_29965 [Cupriavidus sp.]|uniref:hypothetical protein n=1 Tax=Cupriavidus sp. TaxID=1873897 RepID=UPI0025BFCAC1|nr:hypothetical protein [Cupriavidus sp.]MCA3194298.1 hypothetical protein [Cupriavidus sp.]MCA3200406.1 hypothetical protein [Cupriavidus sp.]MCA3233819.1 hypothetical protein [Cupriavidus sp.]
MSAVIARAVGVLVLALAVFSAGWMTNGWRKDAEVERIKAEAVRADLSDAKAALSALKTAGETIRAKADEFSVAQTKLGAKLDAIQKDMKNAKPLPADCRPDDFRMRKLSDAVEAAKQAAAAR